jgi:hypothetical protein
MNTHAERAISPGAMASQLRGGDSCPTQPVREVPRVRRAPCLRAPALAALLLLAAASPARALFHISDISEVLTSYGGSADVQAVEIEMLAGGQTLTQNSILAFFDATGAYVADALVVPGDVPNGGAGLHWLMGTSAFETASGVQVDFQFAPALPVGGGMVCWGAPGIVPPANPGSWDHTDPEQYVDCLAYGSYAGPTNSKIGTPSPLTADGHSLRRVSETDDNATDFACGDPTELVNNAGAAAALAATTPCPEPSQVLLALTGGLLLAAARRQRRA